VSLILVATTPALTLAKFTTSVVDTSDAPCLANISENLKKIEMTLMLFSGAWGKMIQEKNMKQKIL
jgi:hypothetical protein